MESFSHYLYTESGPVPFDFLKVFTTEGWRYLVIVSDDNLEAPLFYMMEENMKWALVNPETLPGWILLLEEQLSKTIGKHIYSS